MIVWLASFPRSGNTFLRIALHRLYGALSSVAYDKDGVAERLGREFVGFESRPASFDSMRASPAPHFIKTHRQLDERIHEADKAIYLVRDGRNALVSWARLQSENERGAFEVRLREMIETENPRGTGGWGANVLSWLRAPSPRRATARFEDLVSAPDRTLASIVSLLSLELQPVAGGALPSFDDLTAADGCFFRKGLGDNWRQEMPESLHDLFWSKLDNCEAMKLLGYS
jgi:hypothetical protein